MLAQNASRAGYFIEETKQEETQIFKIYILERQTKIQKETDRDRLRQRQRMKKRYMREI